ncbi:hypothetical protein Egran_01575 [Elaphomyces granulatus]|uniref:Uncharacterized protein n=1 Tax=Elaphomyces granulatus TaxID=519963 RepID=A0A232M2N4_9EURO|nr:hypothetical protein Egran_01575 [Elaphomyces granulatus]
MSELIRKVDSSGVMPPKKRARKGGAFLVDPESIHPDELSILNNLDMILGQTDKGEQAEALVVLSRVLRLVRDSSQNENVGTIAATSISNVQKALGYTQVEYGPDDRAYLLEMTPFGNGQLSDWAGTAIAKIRQSKYFKSSNSEMMARISIDILFCDRLNLLQDSNAEEHLNWVPEVSLSEHKHCHSREGRLGIGVQCELSIRFSLEAKRGGAAKAVLPQLIVYLAAIQDSRKRADKVNYSVFGVMTDSSEFIFVLLDESRKLFVSNTLSWLNQDTTIVKWIDKILEDAIKSSPPVKGHQMDCQTYQTELKNGFRSDVKTLEALQPLIMKD